VVKRSDAEFVMMLLVVLFVAVVAGGAAGLLVSLAVC
jgi:hypothetical protein